MFGTAASLNMADRFTLRYVRGMGLAGIDESVSFDPQSYRLWLEVRGMDNLCESYQESTVKVTAEVLGAVVGQAERADITMPSDASTAGQTTLEDAYIAMTDPAALRVATNLAVNRNHLVVRWNGTVAVAQDASLAKVFTQYVGSYHAQDVVHLDITDEGCNSNVGLYTNVVARGGLTQREGWCTAELDACGPESFIMGSANTDANRDAIQLYWRPMIASDGVENNNMYDLYVVVSEKQCKGPASELVSKEKAQAWWDGSWMNGAAPSHQLTISARSNLPPKAQCAEGEALIDVPDANRYECGAPTELVMDRDGTVSPDRFQKMARMSAEDLVLAVGAPEKLFGDILDWDSTTKKPSFGPKAEYNTVIPYEFAINELMTPHGFTRNLRYQYMEAPDGVSDPNQLMYKVQKYPNIDDKTGYMYLGKYNVEQVLNIAVEDGIPWYYGAQLVCTGKAFWGTPNQGNAPKCYTHGSSASRGGTSKVIYRRDEATAWMVEYWLTSEIKPTLRDGTLWRRDVTVRIDTMSTKVDEWSKGKLNWGAWSKNDQSAMLTRLNAALDTSVVADQGVVKLLSMEEVAALGPK